MNCLLLVLAAVLSQAPAPRVFSVDAAKSTLGYTLVHKLHTVRGQSKAVEAKAAVRPDGSVQVMVRAAVASFDSGDANRDAHMQEVLETTRWPNVVLKATGKLVVPDTLPADVEVALDGVLDLHGQSRPLKVPVKLEFRSAQEVRATASFAVSLEAHEVERPSLLFVKVDDLVKIEVDLTLRTEVAK